MEYNNYSFEKQIKMIDHEKEIKVNRFNTRFCLSISIFLFLSILMSYIGVFERFAPIVISGMIITAVILMAPAIIYFINDKILKREYKVLEAYWFKYCLITLIYIGITVIGCALTHHVLIALCIPIMLISQYNLKKRWLVTFVGLSFIMIPLTVYIGYFYGLYDKNLLGYFLDDSESANYTLRMDNATPKRMLELFKHYVIPREICLIVVTYLSLEIAHRSRKELLKEATLTATIHKNLERRTCMQENIITSIASVIENRDSETGNHVTRTREYVKLLVEELMKEGKFTGYLTPEKADLIIKAAPLHDIGKITISDNILLKPARLTIDEFEQMKEHSTKGKEIIKNVISSIEDEKFLTTAENIANSHHERYDGNGYPDGLVGDMIPLEARIMTVADVFDALVSKRVYKEAMDIEEAFREMDMNSGLQFDPKIIEAFDNIKPQLRELSEKYSE